MRDIIKSLFVLVAVGSAIAGGTIAAFTASATVEDSTFSTGTAALQMVVDPALAPEGDNLQDSIDGVDFTNIYPGWVEDYGVAVHNTGSLDLVVSVIGVQDILTTHPDLANVIEVRAFAWDDSVTPNGLVDSGEVGSPFGGWRLLSDWETTPFNLGELEEDTSLPVVFRFRTTVDMDDTHQGNTAVYDFVFSGTTDGAVQE